MANLRRSARLSRTGNARRSTTKEVLLPKKTLDAVVEHDEACHPVELSNNVASTPVSERRMDDYLGQLSQLRTPQTEPQAGHEEMNPKTIHQTTTKAPDSGLRLGFADIGIPTDTQRTPSKSCTSKDGTSSARQSMTSIMPNKFQFNFASTANLSSEAQKLMASVKVDAAEIKAQMLADKDLEDAKAIGKNGSRKIATPKGKSSRFSDVHMAEFKKMDSIENHPSAFRTRPGFAAPTSQSLKRKSSRADLDEPVRPRTAGKDNVRLQPSVNVQANSASPRKSIPASHERVEESTPAKRARQSKNEDSSARRDIAPMNSSSTLFSPTKSSMARSGGSQLGSASRPNILPRSSSIKFSRSPATVRVIPRPLPAHSSVRGAGQVTSPARLTQSKNLQLKPLPALPKADKVELQRSKAVTGLGLPKTSGFTSKFASLSNLKSILRSGPKEQKGSIVNHRTRTEHAKKPAVSPKKVDFTPSVKSRYAVKLAAESPVPAKARQDTPYKAVGPLGVSYDASAYTVSEDDTETTESEEDDVVYPSLPMLPDTSGPVVHTFSAKAKAHNRRESQEFRSIFTDLRPGRALEASKLTAINTVMNKTGPALHASRVVQPTAGPTDNAHTSTIRQVRDSGVSDLLAPFDRSAVATSENSPTKKRRYDSISTSKEELWDHKGPKHRQSSMLPLAPGAWTDTILEEQENQDPTDAEGMNRGAKRIRKSSAVDTEKSPAKKPNAAREAAAKNAKERKVRGLLSLSRLNILSRPKPKV